MSTPRNSLRAVFLAGCRVGFVWFVCASPILADSCDPLDTTSVAVMWDDTFAGETGFLVERSVAGGPFQTVFSAPANTDVWKDTGLAPGTAYTYRISPVFADGPGSPGPESVATTLAVGDSMARMRQNALNFWRAIGGSRKSPRMVDALVALDSAAAQALSTLQSDGSWPDINYTDMAPAADWTIKSHYDRLQSMARAWATPGAALHGDATLLAAIMKGIDFIETK